MESAPNYFVANTSDELHCMQACYAMALFRATGERLTAEQAEGATGFRPGRRSWPFAAIASFASAGVPVRTVDQFDAVAFAADPIAEVQSWYPPDSEELARLIRESDLEREASYVREALASGVVEFEKRTPTWDELRAVAADPRTVVVARVNHRRLVHRDGYYGHFVIVDDVTADHVLTQDPGPPARRDHRYPVSTFREAWMWPSEQSAELILVGPSARRRQLFPDGARSTR